MSPVRNRAHAARVVEHVATERAKRLTGPKRRAVLEWLRATERNDKRPAVRAYAAEIEMALRSLGYRPGADSIEWLTRQARRPARFLASRWARWAVKELEGR